MMRHQRIDFKKTLNVKKKTINDDLLNKPLDVNDQTLDPSV